MSGSTKQWWWCNPNPFTHIGMKTTWDAIIRDGLPAPGSGQVGIAITTPSPPSRFKSPPTVSHICIQASWLPVSDNNSLRCLTYHASATLISGSAANFLLFSCVINFFHFASVPCLLWYFKLIADIIATTSVDATSGKNLWYVDYTSCCSDTTLVWNRTRPPSYCPNTSQLFISRWFSKYKKQY